MQVIVPFAPPTVSLEFGILSIEILAKAFIVIEQKMDTHLGKTM